MAARDHTSHERLNIRISLLEEKYHGRIEKSNSPTIDICFEKSFVPELLRETPLFIMYLMRLPLTSEKIIYIRIVIKMKYDFAEIEKKLKKYLDKDRLLHTLGVMYTASALAMAHGADMEQAQIAGLLHDCAKCISNKKKMKLCMKNGIELSPSEKQNTFLIHAKLGAHIAKEQYKISDDEVLSAIRWHTTGKENMTTLEKIVYIADYIEPGRDKAPHLSWVRKIAFMDLDECMYYILKDSLNYLERNTKVIDPATQKAFYYYETLHLGKKQKGLDKHEQ